MKQFVLVFIHFFCSLLVAQNSESVAAFDLESPLITCDKPAAGKRVKQIAAEYKGTNVYHSLYLPTDWKPGKKYPVIVEYTGNYFKPCNSTGKVDDANLGFGISGGKGFIWVVMPYVEKGKKENAITWWGDKQATIDYCKINLPRICKDFGGDMDNVFICGFSRGSIAVSYIGLADDVISQFWKGFITHDHFDGEKTWGYPDCDRPSALARLARIKDRPFLVCGTKATEIRDKFLKGNIDLTEFEFLDVPTAKLFNIPEGKVIHPHTDLWMHKPSVYRDTARKWIENIVR